MKIFSSLLLLAITAISVEKCVSGYLLVEVDHTKENDMINQKSINDGESGLTGIKSRGFSVPSDDFRRCLTSMVRVCQVFIKRFPKVCLDNATWDDNDGDVEKLWDCVRIQCGRGDKTNMHYLERARDRHCKKVVA